MIDVCFREAGTERVIRQAQMQVIPSEGELIQFPRTGTYVVSAVAYSMSDDGNRMLDGSFSYENLMFVTIYLIPYDECKDAIHSKI